jgi:hypothetical protein
MNYPLPAIKKMEHKAREKAYFNIFSEQKDGMVQMDQGHEDH